MIGVSKIYIISCEAQFCCLTCLAKTKNGHLFYWCLFSKCKELKRKKKIKSMLHSTGLVITSEILIFEILTTVKKSTMLNKENVFFLTDEKVRGCYTYEQDLWVA